MNENDHGCGSDSFEVRICERGVTVAVLLPSRVDHIAKVIDASGSFYELGLLRSLAPLLREGDLVIDVGANIGNHSLFFAAVLGCVVDAFEANPASITILKENIRRNQLESRIRVHECVVADTAGMASLVGSGADNLGATAFQPNAEGSFQMSSLDGVAFDGSVALLKIDVEGMELAVLRGAERLLASARPVVVCEAATSKSYIKISEYLGGLGYAGISCHNATDTYVFLPLEFSGTERVQKFLYGEVLRMQREFRDLRASHRRLSKTLIELGERVEKGMKRSRDD